MREEFIRSLTDLSRVEWQSLKDAYTRPARFYHTFEHALNTAEWVSKLPAAGQECYFPKEMVYAALFHDAVYVPEATDNEARSAGMVASYVKPGSTLRVEYIKELILSTCNHFQTDANFYKWDHKVFMDCDIAMFGADFIDFVLADVQIRKEYESVVNDPKAVLQGRVGFLEMVDSRPFVFNTDYFRGVWEDQAKDNLTKLISRHKEELCL